MAKPPDDQTLRSLLNQLGLSSAPELEELESEAERIHAYRHASGNSGSATVTRTSLLYAAMRRNPELTRELNQRGLKYETFEINLKLQNATWSTLSPARGLSSPSGLEAGFKAYQERWPSRPVDDLALAFAILIKPSIALLGRFETPVFNTVAVLETIAELIDRANVPSQKFILSAKALQFLHVAQKLAKESGVKRHFVTSSLLLISMFQADATDNEYTTTRFLNDAVDGEATEKLKIWLDWYREPCTEPLSVEWIWIGNEHVEVSPPCHAILRLASHLADESQHGKGVVHSRHLLAALISFPGPEKNEEHGAHNLLRFLAIDPADLCSRFFEHISPLLATSGENIAPWVEVLRVPVLPQPTVYTQGPTSASSSVPMVRKGVVPWYYADSPNEGKDVLNIESECEAFSKLMASGNLRPPLAVGLFGDWGSGKSYFIRQLKARVAIKADMATRYDKSAFLSRIVQIEFNAWHYAEANLWASLVDHIFRNLRVNADESEAQVERRRERLLEQLDIDLAARVKAEGNLHTAERALTVAGQERESKSTELEAARAHIGELRLKDVWANLSSQPNVQDAMGNLRKALERFGVGDIVHQKDDIQAVIAQLRDVRTRVHLLWLRIVTSPEGRRSLMYALLLLASVPVAGWLLNQLTSQIDLNTELRELLKVAGQGVFLLGGAWKWLSAQLQTGEGAFKSIDEALFSLNAQAETRLKEHVAALNQAETGLAQAQQQLNLAQIEVATKQQDVVKKQEELANLTASRRLVRFLDERAASDDYRKHLGLLALARRDFDELDRLMRVTDPKEMEKLTPDDRVERIILYIDDLDRCSPKRVVEILQAVHLLLALKLFVVVVAVDARWVRNSLAMRHRDLFERPRTTADSEDAEEAVGSGNRKLMSPNEHEVATPLNYLEKIFQIPYWLPRMNGEAARKLIEQLTINPNPPTIPRAPDRKMPKVKPTPPPGINGQEAASSDAGDYVSTERTPDLPSPTQPFNREEFGMASPAEHGLQPSGDELNPPELEISKWEIEWMKSLGELVGSSPRTVKRFVNVYQVVRGAMQGDDLEQFVGSEEKPGEGLAALLLLAASVSCPDAAERFFDAIRQANGPNMAHAMSNLRHSLTELFNDEQGRSWPELMKAIDEYAKRSKEDGFYALYSQLPRVRRFSFGVGSTQSRR